MKTAQIIKVGRVLSVLIVLLGIIHEAATYSPLIKGGLMSLDKGTLNSMLYMSLICGAFLIMSGILLFMLLKHIEKYHFLSNIIFTIGIFLAINGVLSVFYMFDNPFAWLALILNIGTFIITLRLKLILK